MPAVSLTVNGKPVKANVEARTLLVQLLREQLRLTGTHVGCDTSQCGCCVVHVDGKAVKSCTMLALQAEGADVLTIEGLATGDKLHPMQEAFRENHGLQCGFCTGHDHDGGRHGASPWPRPRRAHHPGRARRQHLPVHRVPQYCQIHRRRRQSHARRRRSFAPGGRIAAGRVVWAKRSVPIMPL